MQPRPVGLVRIRRVCLYWQGKVLLLPLGSACGADPHTEVRLRVSGEPLKTVSGRAARVCACAPASVGAGVFPNFSFLPKRQSARVNSKMEAIAQAVCLGHVLRSHADGSRSQKYGALQASGVKSGKFHSQGSLPSATGREKEVSDLVQSSKPLAAHTIPLL